MFNIWLYVFIFGFLLYWVGIGNLYLSIFRAIKKETGRPGIMRMKERLKEHNIFFLIIKVFFVIILSFGIISFIPFFNLFFGMSFLEPTIVEDVTEYALDYANKMDWG